MSTVIEQKGLPVLAPVEHSALNEAFKLPDVSAILVEKLDTEDLVHLVKSMTAQIETAKAKFDALCAPITNALAQADALIRKEMDANGGTELPHPVYHVRLEQATKRDKRIDVLRRLKGLLPDEEFDAAVYVKVTEEWCADLRKLDVAARKYGGKIAEIVEEGSPKVDVGLPRIVIEPRKSALKVAS